MAHRKKVNEKMDIASVQYQNKASQVVSLLGTRKTFINAGRGSAKTTEMLLERLLDLVYEMPGAPVVWVASTFTDLTSNILPAVMEGLERKGFHKGTHYLLEEEPPVYTEKDKETLPEWLRPHFWKPYNMLAAYSRTMIFFTGLNIRFGSLDRPSSLAGGSFVFVFGDEAKYFPPQKIANLLKANRGYYAQYGKCIFYRGQMFTSDMADTSHVGEYDWMEKEAENVDVASLIRVAKAGLIYNEALHEFVCAKDQWEKTKSPEDALECRKKLRTVNRWKYRWELTRRQPGADTLYIRVSSYVNVDILTAEWFADAFASGLPDTRTAILSLKAKIEAGDRFYAALADRHFYFDGIDERAYDQLKMTQEEDCRVLKYLNPDLPLDLGVDFGNMCSCSCAQLQRAQNRNVYRVLKFLFTLAPAYLDELGAKIRTYFAPMRKKIINLYYDRAGNAYKSVGKDQVSELKKAIEFLPDGRRSGWTVRLMSLSQGDLRQSEEYHFMSVFMSETNSRLPLLRIDAYACRELKCSLELSRTKVENGVVYKNKRSEKLPISDLPTKSTNPSDSFKYLLMRKDWRIVVKKASHTSVVPDAVISK